MLGVGRDSTSSEVQSVYLSRGYREGVEAVGVGFSQHHTHTHTHTVHGVSGLFVKRKGTEG